MFLGKILLATLILIASLAGSAQAKPSKDSKPTVIKQFAVGAGHIVFGENVKGVESNALDTGVANYSGVVIYGEHTWTKRRWIYQAAAGFGVGKATASFTNTTLSKRSWSLGYFEGSANYRVVPKISLGAGIVGGSRSADWKNDPNGALSVLGLNKTIYAPEFIMRWNTSRRFTLIQSISTPDFRGATMWRWTGQFNL